LATPQKGFLNLKTKFSNHFYYIIFFIFCQAFSFYTKRFSDIF